LPLGPERNLEASSRLSYAAGVSHVQSDHELERIIPTQGLSLLNFLIALTLGIAPEATSMRRRHYCRLHHPEKYNVRRFELTQ
jgi:hypothetical protein